MATRIKANYGKIDSATALEITKAVAMRDTNLHAVMCNVTDHEIWVAHAKGAEDAWKQPFIKYDLNQLFKRPADRKTNPAGSGS
jgi:type IV secretory pathway ATPase VirB11/archaellum biosynthesis ATPase